MNDQSRLGTGRPTPTYQDIMRSDGGRIADVLALDVNPKQAGGRVSFDRYTSQTFFDREMEKMWGKVWQFACRDEHVPEIGDYYVYDIGRSSIIVVRTADGLRAYYNSCLHRGTKLKESASSGCSAVIQCPYHGWTWGLDGTLLDVPCPWEFPHVDTSAMPLPKARVESWNSLIFVNLSDEGPGLHEYLQVLPDHFHAWTFDDWYVAVHAQKELGCNWKAAQDAFIEAYHTGMVHPQCVGTSGDINSQHDIFSDHVSRDLVALGVPSPSLPVPPSEQDILDQMLMGDSGILDGGRPTLVEGETARSVMARNMRATMDRLGVDTSGATTAELIDSIKYTVFPNLFIFAGFSLRVLYVYRPLGMDPDRCTFDILFMRPVPKDGTRPAPAEPVRVTEGESYAAVPGMDPGFATLFDQDTRIMRLQREGMHASKVGYGTYSTYLESRLRHIHDVIDRYLAA
ncbi:aromatic ring-hydroxylating oxygenase subunit alpha [Sphingomonas profundi]|uniref:aromatic ring-hydroxylating oxygenase subunit alpha n=1 Tax=Alterirhizorhabdus profundi TaxID=2681549 RepID=UPI0012E88A04|nr:aromatic ring-hydroxylating dioxygenase subunit alpha [Sphingomonas profundi]